MNFYLRPYNQYILNIVTNIYLGLDFIQKKRHNPMPLKDYFAETKPTDEITSCPASLLMNSNTA